MEVLMSETRIRIDLRRWIIFYFISAVREKHRSDILMKNLPLYIEKQCERFIGYSINKHYQKGERIKLFGDTVDVRGELLPIWLNDFHTIEGRFRKLVFAITRYSDAKALLVKRLKESNSDVDARKPSYKKLIA